MGLLLSFLPHMLFAYIVLIEPLLRINFFRLYKKQLKIDSSALLLFYRTQILWEWSWVIVLVIIVAPASIPLAALGFTPPNPLGWIIMAALLLGIGLSIVLIRRSPGAIASMQNSLEASAILLPSTPTERKWYAATAITAGICEELLYRGFLIPYLHYNFQVQDWTVIAILSGIIYGLSRLYQGFKGFSQAALTGFAYTYVYLFSGSVLPAMVFHILVELRTLLLWQSVAKKKAR
jgi:membrane protease YdiL (CAAX protease family)